MVTAVNLSAKPDTAYVVDPHELLCGRRVRGHELVFAAAVMVGELSDLKTPSILSTFAGRPELLIEAACALELANRIDRIL